MNDDDATLPDDPTLRPGYLPGARPAAFFAAAGGGWLLNQQTGPLHVLYVVLMVGVLIYVAVHVIKKVLAGDQMSWPKRTLAWWRSIPSAIRTITVSTAVFFVALGVFLWVIGVRINMKQVITDNPWIPVVAVMVLWLGCVPAIIAHDKRATARRAAAKRKS